MLLAGVVRLGVRPCHPPCIRPARRLSGSATVGPSRARARASRLKMPPSWLELRAVPGLRCHDLKTLIPPFPPPGGTVGLRPANDAVPGTRPGRSVRRFVGAAPPPLAKLRSYVATLHSLRRRTPPTLLSPLPRLVVPLPAGIKSVGGWRGQNSPPHRLFRRSHPWRGVRPWPGSRLRHPWLRATAYGFRFSPLPPAGGGGARPLGGLDLKNHIGPRAGGSACAGRSAGERAWAAVGGKSASLP